MRLLEYDNIEGMILLSELSRRRIRSIGKLIRIGRNEVVMCMRVDEDKGYLDLSKRRVPPDELAVLETRYTHSKTVHSIMHHVAVVNRIELEELYKAWGWPLYKEYGCVPHDAPPRRAFARLTRARGAGTRLTRSGRW